MGVRHPEQERLLRLEAKSLDGELREVLTSGLACSPFEAEAVLDAVKQVYAPLWGQGKGPGRPGEISLVAVSAEEPAGKPLAACEKRTISLQVHRGAEDDRLLEEFGPRGFRRARLPELCQQALSQGALLTREDLAFRVFFVGLRTISRDLAWLRSHDERPLALRSTVQDIGPVFEPSGRSRAAGFGGKNQQRDLPDASSFARSGFELFGHLRTLRTARSGGSRRRPDRVFVAARAGIDRALFGAGARL